MTEADDNNKVLCPSCQSLNDPFEAFCHECGAPIGSTATLDPVLSIQSQGFLFRKALDSPRPIVLIGMWIIFLPALLVSGCFAIWFILYRYDFSAFFFFWGSVGMTYVCFIILYRTTKSYIVARRKP